MTSKPFAEQIDYIAGSLSDKYVKELEKLATALFLTMENPTDDGIGKGQTVSKNSNPMSRVRRSCRLCKLPWAAQQHSEQYLEGEMLE